MLNFTVTSRGRQFDRLGMLFLGDIEIFRTSTAEPTSQGIQWTYTKDVSDHLALFRRPQKIIFELGNLIDDTYTASFNTTLTATLVNDPSVPVAADRIIPISARRSAMDSGSSFSIPGENATNEVVLPQNLARALVSLSACGQADEEFWFGNVPSSNRDTFASSAGDLLGYSPFREVQLRIDGSLAGVVWPFPIIFTGGVVPGLWRPIVGIDAFDLRENEIDITPWLPLLCDGRRHTFEIYVVGLDDDGKGRASLSKVVGQSWLVTGKILLWLDEPGWTTRGFMPLLPRSGNKASEPMSSPQIQFVLENHFGENQGQTAFPKPLRSNPKPSLTLSSRVGQNGKGENETLSFEVHASRELMISSIIHTSSGYRYATWSQTLKYENQGRFSDRGSVQVTRQRTYGREISACGSSRDFSYPLFLNTSFAEETSGNFTIDATISRGLELRSYSDHARSRELWLPSLQSTKTGETPRLNGITLSTTQNGTAHYLAVPSISKSFGFGSTEQVFEIHGLDTSPRNSSESGRDPKEVYHRHVSATNGTVIQDSERVLGDTVTSFKLTGAVGGWLPQVFETTAIRGPGVQRLRTKDD